MTVEGFLAGLVVATPFALFGGGEPTIMGKYEIRRKIHIASLGKSNIRLRQKRAPNVLASIY